MRHRGLHSSVIGLVIFFLVIGFGQASIYGTSRAQATPTAITTPASTPDAQSGTEPVAFVWRTASSGPNRLDRPRSVVTDSKGNIYVAEGNRHRILKFDSNGTLLTTWGSQGKGDGQFQFRGDAVRAAFHSDGMTIDDQDILYVLDFSGRVQKFDTNGNFLGLWGIVRSNLDQRALIPTSIAIDHLGNLYVGAVHVGVFESPGTPLPTNVQKFDANKQVVATWDANSTPALGADFPWIAIDDRDNLYLGGGDSAHIWKLDSAGKLLAEWGGPGTGDGQFKGLGGLAVDRQGNVYVGDNEGNRIQKFDGDGRLLGKWGSRGSGDGQFDYVFGIAVDKEGYVYVTSDRGADRLQKFRPISQGNATPASTATAQR